MCISIIKKYPKEQDEAYGTHRTNKKIGQNIRKYRLKIDISQENLAMSAGLYPAYLGRLERGEKCPTIDTLYKISCALGITINELI